MRCRLCQQDKSDESFYKSDRRTCKECIKTAVRENRARKIEHYRAFDNARANRPDRVEARRTYIRTDAGRAAHARASERYKESYPDRAMAQRAVNNAVRDEKLIPWPACALPDCDCTEVEAHHPNYDTPLDVVWLCPPHHKQAHALAKTSKGDHT